MTISLLLMFDKAHSTEGWVCHQSILNQDSQVKIYVLCLDEYVWFAAKRKNCIPIALSELEGYFPCLLQAKKDRTWAAYTQTCKVFLPVFIMDKYKEDSLLYTDSDFLFFSHWQPIEKELTAHSFLATSREKNTPQGRYNGGCFACRDTKWSRAFFSWWQDRVIEWCEWKYGPDAEKPTGYRRFTEEGYLNIIDDDPTAFPYIGVCQHPGLNLAHWNAGKHKIEEKHNTILIDNKHPLICFHYQGVVFRRSEIDAPKETPLFLTKHYHQKILEGGI